MRDKDTYRGVWRWHFYAGLFVLPFVLILSVTGAIYLFKPQIDRWEERSYRALETQVSVSADRQLAAALAAHPGSRFNHYRVPEAPGDAAMIQVALPGGDQRDVYVAPDGKVVGSAVPGSRISDVVAQVHGTLLLGKWGDWLVELAASWTIVMIVTGLYLWWPRPFAAAGTFWPRASLRGRRLLKDVHRVTGFWIAGLVLVMLASGLPWAASWGGIFQSVRAELGWVQGAPDWKVQASRAHGHHGHENPVSAVPARALGLPLSMFVQKANSEGMAFPVLILPPNAPQRFGPPTGNVWTIKSEAQNRPLQRQVTYDAATGAEQARSDFSDRHPIDQVINTGIAWHEGQLFGIANQLLGLLTAIALFTLSILGTVMWLKRKPRGELAAPPRGQAFPKPLIILLVIAALLLPIFGASLLLVLLLDRMISSRTRAAA